MGSALRRYTVEDVDYDPANPTPEGGYVLASPPLTSYKS